MGRRRLVTARPARSAFAAAFLSLLFPGLGHAYLGRWVRAALWAVLPIIGIAAMAGLLAGPDRTETLTQLANPDVLVATMGFIALDLLYRLAAVLDAWRLGRDPSIGSGLTRSASSLGVTAIALVLVISHAAIAQPILVAQDILDTFDGGGGDTSPLPDVGELSPELRDLVNLQAPSSGPGAGAPSSGPTEIPTEEPTLEPWTGEERLDILLVGVDSGRGGQPTFLTDTMMVVSIDPRTGKMALISLPRDTVNVPLPEDFGKARAVYGTRYGGKINTLYVVARQRGDLFPGNDAQRGYRALMGALSELYDLDIDYYVSVNLSGFRGAVNALSGEYGGIIVDVDTPLMDPGYPADDGRGHLKLYVAPGIGRMNGQEALAYARSRKTTSDFDRAERQQQLVSSVRDQLDIETLLAPGALNRLFTEYKAHVATNIPARMLPGLLSLALDVDFARPKSLVLSPGKGFSVENDSYELEPNIPRIRRAVQNVFKSPKARATNDG